MPFRCKNMKRKHTLLPTILALSIGIFPSLVLSKEVGLRTTPVGDGAAQNLLSRIDALGDIPVNKVTVEMSFTQPLDHQNPEAGTFDQKVVLIHKGFEKPLVLWLEGYAWKDNGEQEITRLLAANQLSVEHRYFGDSKPGFEKWRYLTIEQAAADHHRIVQAFKRIYTGKWINSGTSKGGQTTMYHRRFYPDDVDASVCYVAPLNFSDEEPRFADFFESVGNETLRKKVVEFQKLVLEKKEQLLPLFNEYSAEKEFTYKIGAEAAFEYCALEYSFSYWQWNKRIKSEIPTESASIQEIFDHFIVAVDPYYYSDKGVSDLTPFFHQALNQIGFYSYDTSPFDGLLTAAREPTFKFCAPEGTEPVFDPKAMQDIHQWITTKGNNMIFIYGEMDPWSASAVQLTGRTNSLKMVKKGGEHTTRIKDFEGEEKDRILDALQKWLDVEVERDLK